MKRLKFCLILVTLAIIGMPVWSQNITFGAWGRVVITPLASSGDYSAASAATSTWGDAPYISFSVHGIAPSKNIGFDIDFDFGYNVLNGNYNIVGDNAKAWVNPLGLILPSEFNMLKLVAGRFHEDELRGQIGATEFGSWILPNGSKDEDNIFTRFKASAGAYVRLEPLKWLDSTWNGLTLHMAFGSNTIGAFGNGLRAPLNLYNNEANNTNLGANFSYDQWGENDGPRLTSAKDVFRAGQYAVGYRVPDVGLARFQFIGRNRNVFRIPSIGTSGITKDEEKQLVVGIDRGNAQKNTDIIEFAFLYDGLPGLKIDAGVKLPLEDKTKNSIAVIDDVFTGRTHHVITDNLKSHEYTIQLARVISVGANWTPSFLEALNIQTRLDYSFGAKIERDDKQTIKEDGAIFNFWLTPSYKVLDALSLGVDFGMEIKQEDKAIVNGQPWPVGADLAAVTRSTDFGFAPWFELEVGGGKVRTGVVVMIPGIARYKNDETTGKVNPKFLGDPVISVPISITYSF